MIRSSPPMPLPEPLRGAEIGSFAHDTIVNRLPEIGRRILRENELPPTVVAEIVALIDGIPDEPIRPLIDPAAPDLAAWQEQIASYPGASWLEVPWFFAETYFYRRVVEATGYFRPGDGQRRDPYALQKELGLTTRREAILAICENLEAWNRRGWSAAAFGRLLSLDLWGNQADLSLWPAGDDNQPAASALGSESQQQEQLLADDTECVFRYLDGAGRPGRIDFIVDNAGFELFCDLCLADFLLSSGAAADVRMHLKIHPTFVSDATTTDVVKTISWLAGESDRVAMRLAARLADHRESGRMTLNHHSFWTSPLEAWKMPEGLAQELSAARLVISKGDANYRRLLGDRHWPFATPFSEIVSYFLAPLLALRTLKSEVASGLRPAQIAELDRLAPGWLTNGHWGVIQFAESKEE